MTTATETDRDFRIAQTIGDQLGGFRRLQLMTGAKDFVAMSDGLMFRIGTGAKNRINKIRVILTPADTYTVHFMRVTRRGLASDIVAAYDDIYADMLVDLFERETGLYLSF